MSYGPRGAGAGGGADRRSHASVLEALSEERGKRSGKRGRGKGEEEDAGVNENRS